MSTATPLAAAALLAAAVPTAAAPQSAAAEPGPAVGGRSEIFAGGEMESYVRYLQSLGIARPYPWSVRGFSPRELDAVLPADSVAHPWRSRYDLRGGQRLGTFADYVRPAVTLRYNSAFPFGGNDGAVWAGRGLTTAVQGGVAVRFAAARAELSMTLAPIAARAENGPFALASPLNPTTLSPFADAGYGSVVDRPQRFGTGAYSVVDPGQSTVRVDAGPVAVGISTANQVWGPAERFNAVLGNNAAGFAHVYVGTARPLDLKLVRVHGRAVWGRLEQSDYSPVTGPAKFASPEQPGTRRFMAGLVGTVQPGALPGLELGVSRFYHSPWPEGGLSGAQFTKPFEAVLKADLGPQNGVPGDRLSDYDNQLASLFGRWVFPGTGFELYGEYAREDHNYNARDLVQEPDHEAGYVVGARKAYLRRDGRILALRGEVINFEMPGANMANFRKNSTIIAKAGIYDLRLHHDEVVAPILRFWKVFDRTDFGPAGEQAREELAQFLTGLDAQATKFVESRERLRARVAARGETPAHV
jgi:hypothetical protein